MIIIYGDKTKTKIGNKSSQTHAEIRVGYKRFCRSLRHELTVNGAILRNKSLTTASVYRIAMALDMDPRDMFFPTDEEETVLSFSEKE